jgi:hypothetical protein
MLREVRKQMTGLSERPSIVPRRRDRNRRVRAWALWACAGAAGAAMLWPLAGGAGLLALAAGLAIGHRSMIAPEGIPVLTYHSVSPDSSWLPWAREIAVHPDTLRSHLRTIRAMGCSIISTRDLVRARCGAASLPPRPVVLHFDDGYLDNWLYAAPILKEVNAPATFFASVDFIAPGDAPRPGGDHWGYMNWAELTTLDADPLFEVEPHGIDHGRVPVSNRIVGRLTRTNWRSLAWLQWAAMPGPKHDWYLSDAPPAVPLGSPVPESEGALAAPALINGHRESEEDYRSRVGSHLATCAGLFRNKLGRDPAVFCWPENRVSEAGREIAAGLGYAATTGGIGRNTAAEPGSVLSRIHAGDYALGFRFGPAERLRIRAAISLFRGNHYWYFVAAPMDLVRRIVMRARDAGRNNIRRIRSNPAQPKRTASPTL